MGTRPGVQGSLLRSLNGLLGPAQGRSLISLYRGGKHLSGQKPGLRETNPRSERLGLGLTGVVAAWRTMLTSPGVKASPCPSTALVFFTLFQRLKGKENHMRKHRVAAWEGRTGLEGGVTRDRS